MKHLEHFLIKLNKAFAQNNSAFIIDHVSDNIFWQAPGAFSVKGIKAFSEKLKEMAGETTYSLNVHQIIIQGNKAAVNGEMYTEGNPKRFCFCDLYTFEGTQKPLIKDITSYMTETIEEV